MGSAGLVPFKGLAACAEEVCLPVHLRISTEGTKCCAGFLVQQKQICNLSFQTLMVKQRYKVACSGPGLPCLCRAKVNCNLSNPHVPVSIRTQGVEMQKKPCNLRHGGASLSDAESSNSCRREEGRLVGKGRCIIKSTFRTPLALLSNCFLEAGLGV